MKRHQRDFLVINGKTYDAKTGMVVHNSAPSTHAQKKVFSDIARPTRTQVAPTPQKSPATSNQQRTRQEITAKGIHRTPQKAQTLYRGAVQAPKAAPKVIKSEQTAAHTARNERIQNTPRHNNVQRFTPAPKVSHVQQAPKSDISPSIALNQLQAKMQRPQHTAQSAATIPSHELKEQLIKERLAEPAASQQNEQHDEDHYNDPHEQKVNRFFSKQPRLLTALAGAMSVLLLVGYVTYLNMPAISMRVAASRAGFDASMPSHKPSGYSLSGPVAYSPGQVTINFASNTNEQTFSLNQRETNWDAKALLDNHVSQKTDHYLTYQEKGLTVYIYDGKASWVNGNVWYDIEGEAQLSSEQILKLATSM